MVAVVVLVASCFVLGPGSILLLRMAAGVPHQGNQATIFQHRPAVRCRRMGAAPGHEDACKPVLGTHQRVIIKRRHVRVMSCSYHEALTKQTEDI